jgi:hypothetical protein
MDFLGSLFWWNCILHHFVLSPNETEENFNENDDEFTHPTNCGMEFVLFNLKIYV